MKNNQDIGSALKSKLEDLHDSPDDFVWDAIEEKLKKKKRRLLFWYFTFGLGILILALFIFNPFGSFIKNGINDLKSKEQNIEIVEQEKGLNPSTNTNIENKNSNQQTNDTLNIENELSSDDVSSTKNSPTQNKTLTPSVIHSKNSRSTSISSENQKLDNTQPNQQKSDTISQTNGLATTDTDSNSSNYDDKTDLKSSQLTTQAREKSRLLELKKEREADSLSKIETEGVAISEEEKEDKKDDEPILENEKVKDSTTERVVRWSINPQLTQSNYGAFSAKTSNNTSTNYGLLLGVRMTKNSFLRFGVRKLDLMQTINDVTNNVSYLEIPLEVKYFFRNKKFNPYLTGGVSYFILENNNSNNPINLEYGDNFSLNFGLGLEHKLFDRFYINLESNFNYQIEPITTNIDYTPYIFSISTGLDYRF